jgi:hypothetical protein
MSVAPANLIFWSGKIEPEIFCRPEEKNDETPGRILALIASDEA